MHNFSQRKSEYLYNHKIIFLWHQVAFISIIYINNLQSLIIIFVHLDATLRDTEQYIGPVDVLAYN